MENEQKTTASKVAYAIIFLVVLVLVVMFYVTTLPWLAQVIFSIFGITLSYIQSFAVSTVLVFVLSAFRKSK